MKYYLATILGFGLFFLASTTQAASPTFATNGTTTINSFDTGRTSNTFTHTVPALGSDQNTALICLLGDQHAAATSGVSWNGVAMTEIKNFAAVQRHSYKAWYLASPTPGTNQNIVETYNESRSQGATWCFTLKDTAQSSPLDASGQSDTAGGTSLSKSITTTVDSDLVITTVNVEGSASNTVADAGQTTLGKIHKTELMDSSHIPKDTAGAITTGYSWTTSTTADLYVISIKYLAPSAVGEGEVLNRRVIID